MKSQLVFVVSLVMAVGTGGCTTEELPTAVSVDLESAAFTDDGLAKHAADGSISFTEGRTAFGAVYARTGEAFLDPEFIFCDASAALYFEGGHDILLEMTEAPPCDRTIQYEGTLTPGGAIKLMMPDSEIPGILEHTGCTLTGSFPVYHGRYDGERFYATTQFHGACDGGNLWGPWLGVSLDKGPIHVTFYIDLSQGGM